MKIILYENIEVPLHLKNLSAWEFFNGTIVKNIHARLFDNAQYQLSSKTCEFVKISDSNTKVIIKDKVSFNNGKNLDSKDIVWSIERAIRLKSLRYEIFKNSHFSIKALSRQVVLLQMPCNNRISILDELTAIAYSIFPSLSLSSTDYLPLNTPHLGSYTIDYAKKHKIKLTLNKNSNSRIKEINILPNYLLKNHKNIFTLYPNSILRGGKFFFDFLNDNTLQFYEISNLYRYLIPNINSPFLHENFLVLSYLCMTLERDKLAKIMQNLIGISIKTISFFNCCEDESLNCLPEQFPVRNFTSLQHTTKDRTIKIFGGPIPSIKDLIVKALNIAFFEDSNIYFSYVEKQEDADFLFLGHNVNQVFPLKSLKYFFGHNFFQKSNHATIQTWNNFFNITIIPSLSKPKPLNEIKAFNELNREYPLCLPIFLDKIGYICKKDLSLDIPSPQLLQDWSQVK